MTGGTCATAATRSRTLSRPANPALTALWLQASRLWAARSCTARHRSRREGGVLTFCLTSCEKPGARALVEGPGQAYRSEGAGDDFFGSRWRRRRTTGRGQARAKPSELRSWRGQGACVPACQSGCIWSARAAAFAWCDRSGDPAPWDRLAALQLPGPRRGPDDDSEPAATDVPAVDADVESSELFAAQLPQVLVMHDGGEGSQMGLCSGEPSRGNQDLDPGEDAHHDSMGT